ncbi:Hypothetical predicted protein [Octopus vulgaris]|uniref:Uncharacterized protein n=1 Tax=Octopus vulgaris TaxID=6645 RepID=A0AA36BDK6_OCTVU|nr:Hypothetical predicted protein [Octopus vulgaris]
MEPHSFLVLAIIINPVNCLLLPRWKYKTKLGHIEYCCRCGKDFVKEDVIQECFLKNKHNHYLLPFCNCYQGSIPKCPETVTICNRTVVCPSNTVYNEFQVPFMNNATLTCNDTLQWEPSFQCPKGNGEKTTFLQECPHNVSVCGKNIQPTKTVVGTEFEELLFGHRIHFKCQSSCEWQYDYQCANGKEAKAGQIIFICSGVPVFLILLLLLVSICYCKSHKKKGSTVSQYFKDIVGKCMSCVFPCKREVATNATNDKQLELIVSLVPSATSDNNTSDVEERRQLSCTALISNINNENTCEQEQPRDTLQLIRTAIESESNNSGDSGYCEGTHEDDAQQKNCGNDILLPTANNIDDSIYNHDESLPTVTPTPKMDRKTKSKLLKTMSLSFILGSASSKIQNGSLLSLPDNLDEPKCRLSIPVQEHGSTAVSAYALASLESSFFDIS